MAAVAGAPIYIYKWLAAFKSRVNYFIVKNKSRRSHVINVIKPVSQEGCHGMRQFKKYTGIVEF